MADGATEACWCTALPPAVAVPQEAAGCWCPACLRAHIAAYPAPVAVPVAPAAD